MRITAFGVAVMFAASAVCGAAAAQGAVGFPMGDVGQVLRQYEQPLTTWAPPPGPLKRLSKASRKWVAEETRRQAETPSDPLEVAFTIEAALQEDVLRRAKRERIRPQDFYNAILFRIMLGAEASIARQAGKAGDGEEAAARLAQARANREWAAGLQSQNSLYMAAM